MCIFNCLVCSFSGKKHKETCDSNEVFAQTNDFSIICDFDEAYVDTEGEGSGKDHSFYERGVAISSVLV